MVVKFRPTDDPAPPAWEDCYRMVVVVCMSRRAYVRSACDLDDLTQDALLLALRRWRAARAKGEGCPHLPASIARYATVDALRGKGYRLRGAMVRRRPVVVSSDVVRSRLEA